MIRNYKRAVVAIPLVFVFLTGCGAGTVINNTSAVPPTNTAGTNRTVIVGGNRYQGAANLKKLETTAKSRPNDANAQVQAGISARVNGNDDLAIQYYQKAIALDPNNGTAYNNIGNIYFRDKNNPQASLTYYKKATQVQPGYVYGWWNLASAQLKLGQKAAAQETVNQGLKVVSKADPNYKNLANVMKGQK